MKAKLSIVSLLLLCVVCGCVPEKRVVWSPDGKQAAIVAADGLRLCDDTGTLSPRLIADAKRAVWLPDSRHLLVARSTEVKTWNDLTSVITPQRQQELIAIADKVREAVLAYSGDWDKFKPAALDGLTSGEGAAVILYIRDHRSEGVPEKLGEKWAELQKATTKTWTLGLYDVGHLTASAQTHLLITLEEPLAPVVSPDGKFVAFLSPLEERQTGISGRLFVSPIGGGPARIVANLVGMTPDWSPDGRSLVYVRMVAAPSPSSDGEKSDPIGLGAVSRREVCTADGRLLDKFPAPEDLAGLLFQEIHRVKCLRDGRILFSASETRLPCTAKDMPSRMSIFALDPARSPTVTRVVTLEAEGNMPDGTAFFELSPDERRIAVAGVKGDVAVYTLATGELVEVLGKPTVEDSLRTIPVWRSADELCFATPHPEGDKVDQRGEIAIWTSARGIKPISGKWPNDAVRGLLSKEPDANGAASQPANNAAKTGALRRLSSESRLARAQ